MSDALIEKEFAGYRIESRVGRGGMGVVHRATDLSLDRAVALKVLTEVLLGALLVTGAALGTLALMIPLALVYALGVVRGYRDPGTARRLAGSRRPPGARDG